MTALGIMMLRRAWRRLVGTRRALIVLCGPHGTHVRLARPAGQPARRANVRWPRERRPERPEAPPAETGLRVLKGGRS